MHWAQNTAERHRLQSLKNVYISRNPETANLTENELRQIVNDDGEDLQKIIANMQLFNSNIVGSNAYFYKHCRNLEGLVEAYSCPTIWFTFSVFLLQIHICISNKNRTFSSLCIYQR